jgi:hypothetical protein
MISLSSGQTSRSVDTREFLYESEDKARIDGKFIEIDY